MLKKIFLLLILVSSFISAQEIFFAESYTTDGQPVNPKDVWNVNESEQVVYVILKAGEQPIKGPIVYMFVDKSDDGQYFPFDSKAIKFEKEKKKLVYRYTIKESGTYSFYFQNSQEKEIAQKYVTVNLSGSGAYKSTIKNSLYYEGSKITFCQVVIEGKPINIRKVQSLGVHGHLCYVHINNFRPLNSEKLLVYFYRKPENSFEYSEFIDAKKYKVMPEWEDAFFKYSFDEPGDYKVIVYNENELIMGNGFIRVVK